LATKGLDRSGNLLITSGANTVTLDVPNLVMVNLAGTVVPTNSAVVTGNGSLAFAPGATAAGTAVAVGEDSEAATNGLGVGYDAKAAGVAGTAVGRGTRASGASATGCGFFARARGNRSLAFGTCDVLAPNNDAYIIGCSDGTADCTNSTSESFMVARVIAAATTTILASNNTMAFLRGRLHSRVSYEYYSGAGTAGVVSLSPSNLVGHYLVLDNAAVTQVDVPNAVNTIAGDASYQLNWWENFEGGDFYLCNRTGGGLTLSSSVGTSVFDTDGSTTAHPWTINLVDASVHHLRMRKDSSTAVTWMYMSKTQGV
jgi:hypothetical protein